MLRRSRSVLVLAPVVGVIVGLVMSSVRFVVIEVLWPRLMPGTLLTAIVVPAVGLAVSGLLLQFATRRRPEIHDTEAYIRRYHEGGDDEATGSVPVKVLAAAATIGFGGAAGLEGPAVDAGSSIGLLLRRLLPSKRTDVRVLLAAGAAAGVSAVFKTPLTGVLFALEVPFKGDVASEALVPTVLSSSASYLVAAALFGTEPLFPVARGYTPDLTALALSIALGLVVGIVARLFVALLGLAARVSAHVSPPLVIRTAGGGVAVGVMGAISLRLFGAPLALGPGYDLINAATSGRVVGLSSLWLFVLRSGAVLATLASGAAGGSFFPLLSLGASAGSVLRPVVPHTQALLPLAGMAAFLSAGYGIPLTAAVFIAESTGAPGYVIPGLLAAAFAYLTAGSRSLSHLQRPGLSGRMRSALQRPIADVMTVDVVSVPADTDVTAFVVRYVVAERRKSFPVIDAGRLAGMVALKDVEGLKESEWASTSVSRLMTRDIVTAVPSDTAADVLARMEELDIDRVPVVDPADASRLVGIVSASDLRPLLS